MSPVHEDHEGGDDHSRQSLADPQALRSAMRADLVTAMKARQPDVVSALRTALAAIDNAEAVYASEAPQGAASDAIAGAQAGVGSTEVERRMLSIGEVRAILQAQVTERLDAADGYDLHERRDAAEKLRREAAALEIYLVQSE